MRVTRPTVLDRAREGVADDRWRLEVWLAELEVNHVDAGPLELLGSFGHLDREKRLDLLDPPSERHARLLIRRRAIMICQSMPGPCRSTLTLLPA